VKAVYDKTANRYYNSHYIVSTHVWLSSKETSLTDKNVLNKYFSTFLADRGLEVAGYAIRVAHGLDPSPFGPYLGMNG
jgi:hypothetical protein